MDAMEALRTRQSIRSFLDKPVARELIEEIVDAGRLAATARNVQPWEFVVVTDPEMRRQIADISDYGKFIAEAPVCIVVLCEDGKYYLEDGSAATENILVAAHALGLGACWVAGDKKPYAGKIVEIVGGPGSMRLVASVAVGYPAESPGRASKRSLKEVLHWEKY
jgi:nitroreductase